MRRGEDRVACCVDGEAMCVDDPDTRGHRVDPEADPGQIEEGQRGHELDPHPRVGEQQLHRTLGDDRRPGHGVQHRAVGLSGPDEGLDDRGVDVVERGGGLVDMVERGGVRYDVGRRVSLGAHEAVTLRGDGREGPLRDEVRVTGAESDDDDSGKVHVGISPRAWRRRATRSTQDRVARRRGPRPGWHHVPCSATQRPNLGPTVTSASVAAVCSQSLRRASPFSSTAADS